MAKSEVRKYREPRPGTKAAETIAMFREAGIECNMLDYAEGVHILTFFSPLPEEGSEATAGEEEVPSG